VPRERDKISVLIAHILGKFKTNSDFSIQDQIMVFNEHHNRFPYSTNVGYVHRLDASLQEGLCTMSLCSVIYGNDLTRLSAVRD
jgi:hypothetical protein